MSNLENILPQKGISNRKKNISLRSLSKTRSFVGVCGLSCQGHCHFSTEISLTRCKLGTRSGRSGSANAKLRRSIAPPSSSQPGRIPEAFPTNMPFTSVAVSSLPSKQYQHLLSYQKERKGNTETFHQLQRLVSTTHGLCQANYLILCALVFFSP